MKYNEQPKLLGPINLQTKFGEVQAFYFAGFETEGIVIIVQPPSGTTEYFVRVHSSCVFSEALGATDCDCAHYNILDDDIKSCIYPTT